MKRRTDNKGFSLVELIIVIAIMGVLITAVLPQYARYLERAKKSRDCNAIAKVLDACEVIGLDPDVTWTNGDTGKLTISITSTGTTYSDTGDIDDLLDDFVPAAKVVMQSREWPDFTIYAIRNSDGTVTFDIANDDHIDVISRYSNGLAARLE